MASFTPLTGAGGSSPLTYYISSGTLPAGLSLSASTGAVTGTPTGAFASSNIVFAVKDANNSVATTTSTVSFTVNLATPVLSGFNLSSTNLVYGASAPTITAPTSASSGAITYSSSNTSVATVSGSTITIVGVGTTTLTATQAANGNFDTASSTKTLTVAAASTATLSGLALSSGTLSPTFATGTGSYTAAVTNATSSITVTPTVTDSNATVKVNGTTVNSGSASGAIALTVGSNTITTVVTAQDGTTTQTYTTTITRAAASTATLSGLALSSGTLSPTFATGTGSYTAAVTNTTSSITVTPTVTDSNATVKVNGTSVTSGSASGAIALTVGSNTITTVVTAQDGTTTQTYTTTVTRAAASTATLSGLALSSGTLSPTFASGTGSYTAAVTNATSSITVTPTVTDSNATVKVNGTTVASGSASGVIALTVGSNTITTVVTAQDGTTTQTYTTTVTRAALLAQANLTVTASPNALTATSSTSTLSTSGGSGTGAVSYAMTAGTCALSGSTVTAGSANETCTVTATKAADGTYLAATAIVNISVTRRASIAAAATDASVASVHSAQLLQAQKFANTQIQNITNHLDTFRHNFNLQPSNFGFSINTPSLGQLAPVFYKVKDELTFRPNDQSDVSLQKTGYRQTGYPSKQMASLTDDYNNPDLLEQQSHQEAQQGQYVREPLSYSIWTAGTIDVGTFKSGDNKETTNKFRANGLTMGLDYKLSPTAIIGGAFGFGTGQNTADTLGNKVKSTQKTLTGYGMWGFGDTWVVDGLLGYGDLAFTGDRTTSDGLNLLSMNRKGTSTFGSASISKIFRFGGFKISPFVRADLLRINLGQYNETGAADYALGYDKTSYLTTTVSTGLHFAYDAYYDSGKLTTSAKISGNRAKTGSLSQDIYFADSGAAGGIYTLQQAASFQSSTSLHLGLMYTSKGGDAIDLGWMGAVGANQYKLNGLRFGLRFAM
ncbi:Cadherin-like beta sandwich domain containing protein [Burkholderiaceae bacterium]